MATKVLMTDGTRHETIYATKGINPFTDETPGVWTSNDDTRKAAQSVKLVPSVYAGISARMQAMADMPFIISSLRGDKEIDNSDNYKNAVKVLPNPSHYLSLTEGALVSYGRAYWFKTTGTKTGMPKGLKYWRPDSVRLDNDKAKNGEIYFKRDGIVQPYPAEQVLYTWLGDPDVELGAPNTWALLSALTSAEANGAITGWVRDYMQRGAIKAMLLMVEGVPPVGEVERMETWWNRFMTGARGLAWKVFNAAGVKPTVVGDGLEALRDLSITKELRYDIHQALGTRHLLEDENFATAQARERQFYTITIVPDARVIQQSINEQLLHNMGYHLEFEPSRLECFQEDETEKVGVLSQLITAIDSKIPPEKLRVAIELSGLTISNEQMKTLTKTENPKVDEPKEDAKPENYKAIVELDKWEAKVKAAGKMVTWHAVSLPDTICAAIRNGTSFEDARKMLIDYDPHTEALKQLAAAIMAAK